MPRAKINRRLAARRRATRVFCAVICCLIAFVFPASSFADGGRVQLSHTQDDWQITIFTAPAPLVVGPVDVSLLLQNARGEVVSASEVMVVAQRPGFPHTRVAQTATHAAATNKLLQSAKFDLPTAGTWNITVNITDAGRTVSESFTVEVGPPLPAWTGLVGWIFWPLLPIGLFILREVVKARRQLA